MFRFSLRPYYSMGGLVALFLAISAGAGLLMPDMYKPFIKSDALRAGLPVQDFVSLLAAPLLVAAMVYTRRGSARAFVVWSGLLLFAGYYYAFYCFGYVYTVFYPLYLAIMGFSVYSLAGLLAGLDYETFRQHIGDKMPVRFLTFVMGMTIVFVPLWLMAIYQGIQAQQATEAGLVFVLDLAFLIPASVIAAVQLWRRRPLGYVLGGILMVKLAISGILLTGGSLVQISQGFAVGPDVGMYIFLLVAGVAGLWLYLRNLNEKIDQKMHVENGQLVSH